MAGRGPAPKDPNRRARANKDPISLRVIVAAPVEQPELPEFDLQVEVDGQMVAQRFQWAARTYEWWQMWGDSPLSAEFTSTDWSELLDTAVIHSRFWNGQVNLASELRLRVAKFGATPEDRARLRIQFAAADEADEKRRGPSGGSARDRRGPLEAV